MDSKGEQSCENENIMLFFSACRRGNIDFIKHLLSLGHDIDLQDSNGTTPLMLAATVGDPYLFHFLIARGSDPTLKDNHGMSLLHYAAVGGSVDIIEKLLFLELDIDSEDNYGFTPLINTVIFERPDALLFLIRNGSDPRCTLTHHFGTGLLHIAARIGNNNNIEKLISLGLDIDSRDILGMTPLMAAAFGRQLESFFFLIEKGSDPLLKDNDGRSVLCWAVNCLGNDIIVKLLSPSLAPFQKLQNAIILAISKYYKSSSVIEELQSPGSTPLQTLHTAIILAISKYDESSSMIFVRDFDGRDDTGYGQLYQLKNENGFIWENRRVRTEELQFGSVVIYWDCGDFNSCECTYWCKAPKEPQDVRKIQKDLCSSGYMYPGMSVGFPGATLRNDPTGLVMDVMHDSGIHVHPVAVIEMKEAHIEDERLYLTTCGDEKFSVKLLCREHLQLSTTSTKLPSRRTSNYLRDCAVLQMTKTQCWPTYFTYTPVCVGLLLTVNEGQQ